MMQSLEERWAALVARGGPELAELQDTIAAAIAERGYLSAEQVISLAELVLDQLDESGGDASVV